MSDRFVGKVIKIEIDGKEYRMKSPPSKHIPRIMTLQGKEIEGFDANDWEIVRAALFDAIRKANQEWSDDEIDEFISENFLLLASKLPIVMGWATEGDMENIKKKQV